MMTRADFEDSLKHPLAFWQDKSKDEVNDLIGYETARMVGYDQKNPHHCYDLFSHTLYTVSGIPQQSSDCLRAAAFFHDIGKPAVAMEKSSKLVFYGHAKKSAEMATAILERMGYVQDENDLICFYISHHDDFISWVLPTDQYDHNNQFLIEITHCHLEKQIGKVMKENIVLQYGSAYNIWMELFTLCDADVSAQSELVYKNGVLVDSKNHKLQKNKLIRDEAKEILCGDKP